MGLTTLFTHLKIILLQYFQFLIFNNNKFNPNTPIEQFLVHLTINGMNLILCNLFG